MPALRALTDTGATYDDPSADVLRGLLADLSTGALDFLIVERPTDPTGQTYFQALHQPDGTYLVEHRDGGPDHHFQTTAPDLATTHRLVLAWFTQTPGWNDGTAWLPVDPAP